MKIDFNRLNSILGINRRNLDFIHTCNPRKSYPLADDKIKTKASLETAGVPYPETIALVRNFFEIRPAYQLLENTGDFVIKPANGRAGGGIVVVRMGNSGRLSAYGRGDASIEREFTKDDFSRICADILFGVYSSGRVDDFVIVERRIDQHEVLNTMYCQAISDIRIILFREMPAMAMLRIPTKISGGKSNLHQGGIGVGIDIDTGITGTGCWKNREWQIHPDTGADISGIAIPHWETIVTYAKATAASFPLKYIGVDFVIDRERGPLVLEVNARPGLQIQLINKCGLLEKLTGGNAAW